MQRRRARCRTTRFKLRPWPFPGARMRPVSPRVSQGRRSSFRCGTDRAHEWTLNNLAGWKIARDFPAAILTLSGPLSGMAHIVALVATAASELAYFDGRTGDLSGRLAESSTQCQHDTPHRASTPGCPTVSTAARANRKNRGARSRRRDGTDSWCVASRHQSGRCARSGLLVALADWNSFCTCPGCPPSTSRRECTRPARTGDARLRRGSEQWNT